MHRRIVGCLDIPTKSLIEVQTGKQKGGRRTNECIDKQIYRQTAYKQNIGFLDRQNNGQVKEQRVKQTDVRMYTWIQIQTYRWTDEWLDLYTDNIKTFGTTHKQTDKQTY